MYHPHPIRKVATALLLSMLTVHTAWAVSLTEKSQQKADSINRILPTLQGDEKGKAMSELFRTYYSSMQVDSALAVLDRLIVFQHKRGNVEREAAARWNVIATLNNATRYDSLLSEADKQMVWFEQHQIWDRYYQAWQRKCSANHDLGRMQSALREAQAMRDHAKANNNNIGRAMAYKQMGVIYFDIHQYEQASDAFQHSIRLLREAGEDTGILSGVYDGYCQTLDRRKLYDLELDAAKEWLDHLGVILSKRGIETVGPVYVSCYLAHTAAYVGMRQFDEAKASLKEAAHYQDLSTSALGLYYLYEMHARLELAQGHMAQALAYTDSTLQLGIDVDEKIDELRAEAFFKTGKGMESADLYRKLYVRKDSLFTRDMRTQLDELNMLFHVDEMKQEQRQAKLLFAIIITALLITALVIIIIMRWRSAKRLEQKNKELASKNKALRLANAQAQESSKMKNEFIKNISHEIRTPLNILSGYTQVLTSPDIDYNTKEAENMRNQINKSTERITGLVNKIIELSEVNTQTTIERNDDIEAIVIAQQAAIDAQVEALENIVFTVDAGPETQDVILHTNGPSATRALVLLLDNAKKFTKEGAITLKLRRDEKHHAIQFQVYDTGIGVTPYEAERIFNEFVQLDAYTEGTGIGLTVARSIARRLGGDIRLDTAYQKGACFILSLPIAD